MRTTLDIDEDALEAASSIARAERKSLGRVVSELVRRALTARLGATETGFAAQLLGLLGGANQKVLRRRSTKRSKVRSPRSASSGHGLPPQLLSSRHSPSIPLVETSRSTLGQYL
jgi:hypothetical protein